MNLNSKIERTTQTQSSHVNKTVIEIRDLRFSYPDGAQALSGVNLDIRHGESLGIIGASGSGKSTLLLHLNGILRGQGRVVVLNLEMTEANIQRIRGLVGLVFQDPEHQLFMPTVFEDVGFGPMNQGVDPECLEAVVRDALAAVGMLPFIQRSPHHLSYGEKKRIALATVLSMKPEVLVMDEPTGNLDPRRRSEIIRLFKTLPMTKVIATHDLELVREICDRAAILNRGKVTALGPVREILDDRVLLADQEIIA